MWVRRIAIENKYGITPNVQKLFYVWTELKTNKNLTKNCLSVHISSYLNSFSFIFESPFLSQIDVNESEKTGSTMCANRFDGLNKGINLLQHYFMKSYIYLQKYIYIFFLRLQVHDCIYLKEW